MTDSERIIRDDPQRSVRYVHYLDSIQKPNEFHREYSSSSEPNTRSPCSARSARREIRYRHLRRSARANPRRASIHWPVGTEERRPRRIARAKQHSLGGPGFGADG